MGKSKTITSPDPTPGADVLTLRGEALSFLESTHLDVIEVLYRSGFSKDSLRLMAEKCGVPDADVVARMAAVDAETVAPPAPAVKPPRGQ